MKKTKLAVSLALLSPVVLSGCFFEDSEKSGQQMSQKERIIPVETITVKETKENLYHWLEGYIKAEKSVQIKPEISGKLSEIHFKEGEFVEKGDLLFSIDDSLIKAKIASSKANVDKAKATLKSTTREYNRSKRLKDSNAISQEKYEQSLSRYENAQASVKQAEAELEYEKVNSEYTKIKAPFSGIIGRSNYDVGSLLIANQQNPLAKIEKLSTVYIDNKMDGRRYLDIQKMINEGELTESDDVPVKVKLENGTIYSKDAKILFTESSVDKDTGTYLMRLVLENDDKGAKLLSGMHTRTKVVYAIDKNAKMIPVKAVQKKPNGGSMVYVVNDGVVEEVDVVAKNIIDGKWRITEGLDAGDSVITRGIQKVSEGSKVKTNESED